MSNPEQLYKLETNKDGAMVFVPFETMKSISLREDTFREMVVAKDEEASLPPKTLQDIFGGSLDWGLIPEAKIKSAGKMEYIAHGERIGRFKHILEVGLKDHPKTPSGWNGPHLLDWTETNVKGVDGKTPIKFQDFEQAIVAANKTKDCGGITLKYSKGKKSLGYYLTVGQKKKTHNKCSDSAYTSQIMCWVKE
jgi:hypothetical protein